MSSIFDTYINALLADASYVNINPSLALLDQLSERMTPDLAKYIADNFEVVAHKESDDTLGSGFDATVWRGKSAQFAGKVYVSMQGTAGLGDFLTDIDLSTTGGARAQWVDMVNWWTQITTPIGQQARQIRQTINATALSFFQDAPTVGGTGLLLAPTSVTVNGHSLGGHLSTAFARIFSGTTNIDHIATFNSAGFLPQSELVFNNLRELLGFGSPVYPQRFLGGYQRAH